MKVPLEMPFIFRVVGGKLYCWDRERESFFFVELSPVKDASLVNKIFAAFMKEKLFCMPEKYYQKTASEDNCVYLFDYEKKKWFRFLEVEPRDLPPSVRASVIDGHLDKELAELALLKSIQF